VDTKEIHAIKPSDNGKLTEDIVRAVRSPGTSLSLTELSSLFRVSVSALSAARSGRTWASFEPATVWGVVTHTEGLPADAVPLKGFPGYYATRCGFIWSTRQTPCGRRLSGVPTTYGHLSVRPVDEHGVQRSILVHRLVLTAFRGAPPDGRPLCLHNDGDPTNNALDNLRWGSPSDNTQDSIRHGTLSNRKISPEDAVDIFTSDATSSDLAKRYGLTRAHVMDIRRGRRWQSATQGVANAE
jgi:hypothetical protein